MILVNDYEFNPREDVIPLKDEVSQNASDTLGKKYPDLFSVLFSRSESDSNILKLNIPFSSYLGTDSRTNDEMLLRSFFDDNSCTQFKYEKYKPIYLSRESLDLEVYKLFCQVIKNVFDCEEDFGWLSLGFDDSRGFVASDGEEEWEPGVMITDEGGHWDK